MFKSLLLAVSLLSSTSLLASSLHKGWEVGSCSEIRAQLDVESSSLWNRFFSRFSTQKLNLEEATVEAADLAGLSGATFDLQSEFEKLASGLERKTLSSLKERFCRGGEYVYRGSRSYDGRPGFDLLRLECLPVDDFAKGRKLTFSFLAVQKGTNTGKRFFNDGKDHILLRSCLKGDNLVTRGNKSRSWLEVDGELCLAMDLASGKWFSYATKKLSKELKDLRYGLGYSVTHYDLNRVLTPGSVTSSRDLKVEDREDLETVYSDLFTPSKCRDEGKPAYHEDYYLQLVPSQKVECAWYDVVCRALNL